MARYKVSDRVPKDILDFARICFGVAYPFHRPFPSRFATDEQFAQELRERLKVIPYPYRQARAKGTQPLSTYDALSERCALDSLFKPTVISSLRLWAEGHEEWAGIRHLRYANTDAGKRFRNFHIPLAKDLARHVNVLRKLGASYALAEEWIGPYVRTVEERLMQETVLLRTCTEEKSEADTKATRNTVHWVYSDVSSALKSAHVIHRALEYHLTSVVCSPRCIITKVLSPDPESVRKLLARDPDKKARQSSN
jgi:hypothetical protein